MRKFAPLLVAVPVVAGCGAGQTPAAAPSATTNLGSLVTRIVGTAQTPVTSYAGSSGGLYEGQSRGAAVTGIAGASITELSYRETRPTGDADLRTVLVREGDLFAATGLMTRLTRLTDTAAIESDPALSPDGRMIVFVRDGDLWKMAIDGTGLVQITSGPDTDAHPAFSPDGQTLVFSRRNASTNARDMFTVRIDGTALTNRTQRNPGDLHGDTDPTFTPDGARIVFVRSDPASLGPNQLLLSVPAGGGALTTLYAATGTESIREPSVSPDSTRVAFVSTVPDLDNSTDIYPAYTDTLRLVDQSGGNVRDLTSAHTQFSSVQRIVRPMWLPDGQRIGFTDHRGVYRPETPTTLLNPTFDPKILRVATRVTDFLSLNPRAYLLGAFGAGSARPLVPLIGANGPLGSAAAGFLVGQAAGASIGGVAQEPELVSALSFDTIKPDLPTRSTARIVRQTEDNVGAAVLLFHVQAGETLRWVRWMHLSGVGTFAPAPESVALNLPTGTTNLLVGFSAATGKVSTVLPYAANRGVGGGAPSVERVGDAVRVRGKLLGAYDGSGRNLAPQGAAEVRITPDGGLSL